jgi:hypothetical protein
MIPLARNIRRPESCRASVIVTALLFVIVLGVAGGAVMSRSLNTYQQADRNTQRLEAQSVADSELEALFYRWKLLLREGVLDTEVAGVLAERDFVDEGIEPATERLPLSKKHADAGWKVKRSLRFEQRMVGTEPGGTGRKTGARTYYTATVQVSGGPPGMRVGAEASRRLVIAETSLFQFALFYQGDLEIASGSKMDIRGPVSTNGNVYVGGANGQSVHFFDRVSFGGTLNGDREGRHDFVMRHPDSPPPPAGAAALTAPRFNAPRRVAANPLEDHELENFVGGVDVDLVLAQSDLFANENELYHSLISPPPAAPVEDVPVIAARRLYNQAGLRLKVGSADGHGVELVDEDGRSMTDDLRFQAFLSGVRTTSKFYDHREGREIDVTTVDVAALSAALNNATDFGFNGILYVEHTSPETGAVRLINGASLPGARGFTFGTNTGVYIQGNYNNIERAGVMVPAAIAADAITLLSNEWEDSNSAGGLSQRVAASDVTVVAGLLTGNTPTAPGRNSGGAQNLIRIMEDWGGRRITLRGSIGQLFESRYFRGPFPTQLGTVYNIPASRLMEFSQKLAETPPPGRLGTVTFLRGDYLTRADKPLSLELASTSSGPN